MTIQTYIETIRQITASKCATTRTRAAEASNTRRATETKIMMYPTAEEQRLLADLLRDGGVEGQHPQTEDQLVLYLETELSRQQRDEPANMTEGKFGSGSLTKYETSIINISTEQMKFIFYIALTHSLTHYDQGWGEYPTKVLG